MHEVMGEVLVKAHRGLGFRAVVVGAEGGHHRGILEGPEQQGDRVLVGATVGVEEDEDLAARFLRASVSRGGRPAGFPGAHNAGASGHRHCGRVVGRAVIHHEKLGARGECRLSRRQDHRER